MQKLSVLKPKTSAERKTRTVMDTILVTPDIVKAWKSPGFQRPVKENDKVRALADELKTNGGVWPGIVSLGSLDGELYVIDGQHRRAAFLISGLTEGYTDIRTHYVETMAEMGEEFVQLNSQLVRMRPDDILRGLEDSIPALAEIRRECPFVGYDMIRRTSHNAPVLSMAVVLRTWRGSAAETPVNNVSGLSTAQIAATITDVPELTSFLRLCYSAWGRDQENNRLWGTLNLILCAWLYRKLVLRQGETNQSRSTNLTKDLFKKCLMSLSASPDYIDWLLGRILREHDRSPAYHRIKAIFAQRLHAETGERVKLPQPAWQLSTGSR